MISFLLPTKPQRNMRIAISQMRIPRPGEMKKAGRAPKKKMRMLSSISKMYVFKVCRQKYCRVLSLIIEISSSQNSVP